MDKVRCVLLQDMHELTDREVEIVQTFAKLLVDWGSEDILRKSLDKVAWGYATYLLKDTDAVAGENTEDLYWVKQLRDIFNPQENN